MTIYRQRQETLNDYDGFVEKFKPKKTTDDCYTPPNVYEVIKNYAIEKYGLDGREIVRPFKPGGDYESYDYPDGCVVIDNPPFSIISQICKNYAEWGVDFFLFAPHLTNFNIQNANHIIVGANIVYENGAKVPTSFVSSFGENIVESAPNLYELISEVQEQDKKPGLPKYSYPDELLTVSDLNKMCKAGIEFCVKDGVHIRALDSQKELKKQIFGSGFLVSREKAELKKSELKKAERKAIMFELSEKERQIVGKLSEFA